MSVIFTKAGLFYEKWNGKLQKNVRRRVKKMTVWTHLRDECIVEEGVTLLDILRTVNQFKMLKLFFSQYSWCKAIEEFHAQAEEPDLGAAHDDDDEKPEEKMTHLRVYWYCNYTKHKNESYVELSPSFDGIGPAVGEYADPKNPNAEMKWGIDFTPIYQLADLPVKLDTDVEFYEPWDHKTKYDSERPPLIKGERCFSLQEVLDAIYWEISFHGAPADKSQKLGELKQSIEEIKNGTADLVEWKLDEEEDEKK